jgi:hypothetical protein
MVRVIRKSGRKRRLAVLLAATLLFIWQGSPSAPAFGDNGLAGSEVVPPPTDVGPLFTAEDRLVEGPQVYCGPDRLPSTIDSPFDPQFSVPQRQRLTSVLMRSSPQGGSPSVALQPAFQVAEGLELQDMFNGLCLEEYGSSEAWFQPSVLSSESQPAVSIDGRYLAFITARFDQATFDALGTEAWSNWWLLGTGPGELLDGRTDIGLLDLTTGEVRRLTDRTPVGDPLRPRPFYNPEFSPDGEHVVANDTVPTEEACNQLTWAPPLFITSVDGSSPPRQIPVRHDGEECVAGGSLPTFSADGQRIFFLDETLAAYRGQCNQRDTRQAIASVSPNGGRAVVLREDCYPRGSERVVFYRDLDPSPDGRYLALTYYTEDQNYSAGHVSAPERTGIKLLDLRDGSTTPIIERRAPSDSCYKSEPQGCVELRLMSANWSPDGSKLSASVRRDTWDACCARRTFETWSIDSVLTDGDPVTLSSQARRRPRSTVKKLGQGKDGIWSSRYRGPLVTITDAPARRTTSRRAVWRFFASDPKARLSCQVNSRKAVSCNSLKYRVSGLRATKHRFRVRATIPGRRGPWTQFRWTIKRR